MRSLLIVTLVLCLAVSALAADTGSLQDTRKGTSHVGSNPAYDSREGGETIGTAVPILALPFVDTGATCDNIHNYDAVCPYSGSTSPDVVYSYTPAVSQQITIDLCNSLYDTKVYVVNAALNVLACNDDAGCGYSGWQSKIEGFSVNAGVTYYIVVDGYGGDCGEYEIVVTEFEPPFVPCPPGVPAEGEPTLVDGYVDNYNGGCNSTPEVFQTIEGTGNGCASLCGISGWYIGSTGGNYRDTDWFLITAAGPTVTFTVEAEYPCYMFVLTPVCPTTIVYQAAVPPMTPTTLTFPSAAGNVHFLWVGPQAFTGPVYEFDYVMSVCGITDGVIPTDDSSWGALKNLYR